MISMRFLPILLLCASGYAVAGEYAVLASGSLKLTDMQFNQVLWRARQRFGDILRKHGVVTGESASVQLIR